MGVFAFAQNYTMVPVQPQSGSLVIDGIQQLNINPYDPSEVQLEPKNGCQVAVPSTDQMYTVAEFTIDEMLNRIDNPWSYWTTELATVPFDATTGYGFLRFSNGKYGYAKFDMSVTGGWTEFGYFKNNVGIAELQNRIEVYPNPATSVLNIKSNESCMVEIFNNAGQLVMTTEESFVDVSEFEAGVYFVSVTFNDGNVLVKKIVKK